MRIILRSLIVLVAAVLCALLWRNGAGGAPLGAPGAGAGGPPPMATAPIAGAAGDTSDRTAAPTGAERVPVPLPRTGEPAGPLLRCRLVGFQRSVPWTTPIQFELQVTDPEQAVRRYRERAVPDLEGTFALRLPFWVSNGVVCEASFAGDDPFYQQLRVTEKAPTFAGSRLATGAIYAMAVQVMSAVRGSVVRAPGRPVPAANVCLYLLRDGAPDPKLLAATSTNDQGAFELRVPAGGDALLVAVAMVAAPGFGNRTLGPRNGPVWTTPDRVPELQPACAVCALRFGSCTEVGKLVLQDSAVVDGHVLRADGQPVTDEQVALDYAPDVRLDYGVCWWRDGTIAAATAVPTRPDGAFVLRGALGVRGRLVVGQQASPLIERAAVAPATFDLQLAAPATR